MSIKPDGRSFPAKKAKKLSRKIMCDAAPAAGGMAGVACVAKADSAWQQAVLVPAVDSVAAELAAIVLALEYAIEHPDRFKGRVAIVNDCQAAVASVARKTPNSRSDLNALSLHFHALAELHGIKVQVYQTPRERVQLAHELARSLRVALGLEPLYRNNRPGGV